MPLKELWLDCSASYAIVPSAQDIADLRSLGFVGAIVGSYPHVYSKALQQLAAFEAGGMRTREYQFPGSLTPTLRKWQVDAENAAATLVMLRDSMNAGADGPYSRIGWANDNLPRWDCKAEYPRSNLWDARYVHPDKLADDSPYPCIIEQAIADGGDVRLAIRSEWALLRPFKSYWGYSKAKISQWHNSITICNVNMDLNEYDPEEEEMKSFLCWVPGSGVHFIGPNGARYISSQAIADELAGQFGPITVALSWAAVQVIGIAP